MNKTTITLAILAIVGAIIAPAWNLTIAEMQDAYDGSATTVYQPELVISAWGTALKEATIAIFIYFTRNQPKP